MAERGCPIGVTGGIGAGKTAVLRLLAELGARTVDADDVVHALYERDHPGHVAEGDYFLGCPARDGFLRHAEDNRGCFMLAADGGVDRAAIAEIVFGDPGELRWLNGVIHPMVRDWIQSLAVESSEPLYCGIPLLFETGWDGFVWRSVAVWCSSEVQRERLRRRGWDEREIRRRLACQLDMDRKLARGDFAIINNGSWDHVREQCRMLKSRLDRLADPTSVSDTGKRDT